MIASMKQAILIYFLLSLVQATPPQGCLKFNDRLCIECPKGMHSQQGQCLVNKPNCQDDLGSLGCLNCEEGYIFDENNNCMQANSQIEAIPITGFSILLPESYDNPEIKNIVQEIKKKFRFFKQLTICKIYQIKNKIQSNNLKNRQCILSTFYRIIFITDTGLLQTIVLYTKQNYITNQQSNYFVYLLNNQIVYKRQGEWFSSLNFQHSIANLQQLIRQLYPQHQEDAIVDTFKSYDVRIGVKTSIAKYRIFVTNPNKGLIELQINVTLPDINLGIQQLDTANLELQLEQIIRQITNSEKLNEYFIGSILENVTKIEKDGISSYHVTFGYPSVLLWNNLHPQSYLVFEVHKNSKKIEISEIKYYKRSEINSYNYIFNKNEHKFLKFSNRNRLLQSVILPTSQQNNSNKISCILPNSSNPTYKVIPLNMVFIQYIDIQKFIISQPFQILRQFIFKYFPSLAIGDDIIGVSKGEAKLENFYEVIYKVYGTEKPLIYFIFSITQSSNEFILINHFRVPLSARNNIIVDARNRGTVQSTSNSIISNILKNYIAEDIIYWKKAQLYQILNFYYESKVFSSSPEFKILRYVFKYYYPPNPINNQENDYQYVLFSYEFIERNQIPVRLNYIAFPRQPFQAVNSSDNFIWQSIKFYIDFHLAGGSAWKNYQILAIWKSSISPTSIFKVSISCHGPTEKYLTMWRINIKNDIQARMISNTTVKQSMNKNNAMVNSGGIKQFLHSNRSITAVIKQTHDKQQNSGSQKKVVESCLEMNAEKNMCLKCNIGCILEYGKCYERIENCESQSRSQCRVCKSGYTLLNSFRCS